MISDSCWMIATVGHSAISRAASLRQSSGTTVSESTMSTISPSRHARPFAAHGRNLRPLASYTSSIAIWSAFSSRSSHSSSDSLPASLGDAARALG